jgi:hypothetical protein
MSLDWSLETLDGKEVFSSNITHNLIPMWHKAGIYPCFYELENTCAASHQVCFKKAFRHMRHNFGLYEKLNAENGWGKAEHALNFLAKALLAVRKHPNAIVRISK